ncbi:Peptidase M30, hyicolysin [Gemmatirosa kalamazoonensis]|uniref:Peptidase M30, hyicolysin n=1 Tax=Gemmatirosa kalamazoonensis TaxID=861299 RepID=W0RF09_9BACT|nr:hypothetical protein [Gemmatirosa kalamazoonensis]AHG89376.1 Peptidase M30, hyicolysin [Gemmatirosa kalamazoonensis]
MSRTSLARHALALSLLAACAGGDSAVTSTTTPTPGAITVVSGGAQSGTVGTTLSSSVVVQVATTAGAPVQGATVAFVVSSGAATLSASSAVTDASGLASTQVTLGTAAGSVVIGASVQGTSIATTITETAVAAEITAPCTPTSLAVGATAVQSGSSVCLDGGTSGAEYAVIPFNGSSSSATRATFVVQAAGVQPVSTVLASSAPTGGLATLGASASVSPRAQFERRLRATERAALSPMVGTARAWYTARRGGTTARLDVIPANPTLGTVVSLNANADDACTRPEMRGARVMAVGSKAIVVADTLNPSGGFTQADYASIAATFDTLVDAVDTKNFGQPTDIDGNGHVILFFTSAVNALTPRNADYYIGGFFYSRDLFPTTATNGLEACASSNVGEMFYLVVPDPSGAINGNAFSKSFVTSATIATTAHEYQHLINSSRRLYVNTAATDFEETWLDEGLAHVAEELVFYARSGLAPLKNLDAATLRANAIFRAAFNDEGIDNFGRLSSYLEDPSSNSPYADDDSLATRGATWSFLRWAVDHQAAAQDVVWQRLVNSTTTGLANLRQVFGSDLAPLFRDWATSLLLDDVAGVATQWQEPSWNERSILDAITSTSTYPLATRALSSGAPTTLSVRGGSAAYLRFTVAAGQTGTVSWTTTGASGAVTVARLR